MSDGFAVEYGRGLAAGLLDSLPPYLALVHPEPWARLAPELTHLPAKVVAAGDLGRAHMGDVVAGVPSGVQAVVGIGGGSAMDSAKWVHHRLGLALYQLPSLPSVDACFTRSVALRDGGRVRYEGDAVPERVVVDFELMDGAPAWLISAGIGDVLSCHTACWDWRLAASVGRDQPLDAAAVTAAGQYLDELEDLAPSLGAREDAGVRRLMELLRDIGARCHTLGHARFEEGSEHFFAYAFEEVTGRSPMHGELVTLGVLVMSTLQGNDPPRPRRVATAAGTRTSLSALRIGWDEVEATLRRLPSYAREEHLWWSAVDVMTIDDDALAAVRAAVVP